MEHLKVKKDTKGRPLNIIIKNVNLRYHNYGCVFIVEDDITKSDKFNLFNEGYRFLFDGEIMMKYMWDQLQKYRDDSDDDDDCDDNDDGDTLYFVNDLRANFRKNVCYIADVDFSYDKDDKCHRSNLINIRCPGMEDHVEQLTFINFGEDRCEDDSASEGSDAEDI